MDLRGRWLRRLYGSGEWQRAKASVAAVEIGESSVEICFGEIRPHTVGEKELGIGALPEEKVGEALFAACADQQVDFGVVCGEGPGEVRRQRVGRSWVGGIELRGCDRRGARDGVSGGVVDGDAEVKAATSGSGTLGLLDRVQDRCWKAIATADHFEARALLAEAIGFKAEEGAQKPEDALDFSGWATPVVRGEGVEGEAADADVRRVLDYAASSSQAGAMTGDTGQTATRRPAAIAVHDDGDVKSGLKIRLHMKSLPRIVYRSVRQLKPSDGSVCWLRGIAR